MIDYRAVASVMRFAGESGERGTAFVAKIDSAVHLVTARHLCNGEPSESITVDSSELIGRKPFNGILERVDDRSQSGDIAIFRPTQRLVPDSIPITYGLGTAIKPGRGEPNGIGLGQELFLLGYPAGLQTVATRAHVGGEITLERLALVKRATAAGFVKQDGVDYLVLDAVVVPGMSGGPVVYFDHKIDGFRVGAVVIAHVVVNDDEHTEPLGTPLPTGLGIAQVITNTSP